MMAAAIKTENSLTDDPIIQWKLETASIVENCINNLDAKILTDSILQRPAGRGCLRDQQGGEGKREKAAPPTIAHLGRALVVTCGVLILELF